MRERETERETQRDRNERERQRERETDRETERDLKGEKLSAYRWSDNRGQTGRQTDDR